MKKTIIVNSMKEKSKTSFLKADSDELKSIVEKRGLKFEDERDFAFFKNVYALTDKANKNGAILPKDSVEKALHTIVGKPIDIDHIRSNVIGHYLDAKVEEDTIYSYGVIYKSNFNDEWETAKKLFDDGKLSTSFEIWCEADDKTLNSDGTYTLDDFTIAGGAILFTTEPAEEEAKVLEMAKKKYSKESNLVFASKLGFTEKENKEDQLPEKASYCVYDTDMICRMIYQIKDPKQNEEDGYWYPEVLMIDYENNLAKIYFENTGTKMMVELTPQATVVKGNSRKIKSFYPLDETSIKKSNTEVKRMDEITIKKEEYDSFKSQIEALKAEVSSLTEKNKESEASYQGAKSALEKFEKSLRDQKVAQRKEELSDFAKDMSEEDLLNDDKYENAKLRKQISELKVANESKETNKEDKSLEAGSKKSEVKDEILEMAARINKLAFSNAEVNE